MLFVLLINLFKKITVSLFKFFYRKAFISPLVYQHLLQVLLLYCGLTNQNMVDIQCRTPDIGLCDTFV